MLTRPSSAHRASVLDLGSNSFHVLVADLHGAQLTPVLREREMLHLGAALARDGTIPSDAVAQAVDTTAHLSELARRSGAEQRLAVATAAIRDASNGPEVIAALSDAAGTPVAVLDGEDEARLGYLGVRAAVAIQAEPTLVLDLGGGSLEVTVGIGQEAVWAASVPIGVSRLSTLAGTDPMRKREAREIRDRVDAAIDPLIEQVRAQAPSTTIVLGGTVRALARTAAALGEVWLPATVNQLRVSLEQLSDLRTVLLERDLDARASLPAMKRRRADHIHVAAVILTRVLERLGITTATVSDWGLREGMLLDAHGPSSPPTPTELRHREVERLRLTFVPDDPHPSHVAHLALQLFDGTDGWHGLEAGDRELLAHAARLHSIGESVALRRQHEHGAYLVSNSELRGFAPEEMAVLTTLVRFHPSRGIDTDHAPYASLSPVEQERTHRLLALLQLADALDRARDQAVERVVARRDGDTLHLELHGNGLHVTPAELERRTRWFTRVFAVEVAVTDLAAA
jgi:exopolyphosphatase / guanosine-5'-triphosphate,3'-diphosphate pyrophosphatase